MHTISVALDIEQAWFAAQSTAAAHAHVSDEAQASGRDAHAKLGSRTQHGPLPAEHAGRDTRRRPPEIRRRPPARSCARTPARRRRSSFRNLRRHLRWLAPSGCAEAPPQRQRRSRSSARAKRFMTVTRVGANDPPRKPPARTRASKTLQLERRKVSVGRSVQFLRGLASNGSNNVFTLNDDSTLLFVITYQTMMFRHVLFALQRPTATVP